MFDIIPSTFPLKKRDKAQYGCSYSLVCRKCLVANFYKVVCSKHFSKLKYCKWFKTLHLFQITISSSFSFYWDQPCHTMWVTIVCFTDYQVVFMWNLFVCTNIYKEENWPQLKRLTKPSTSTRHQKFFCGEEEEEDHDCYVNTF